MITGVISTGMPRPYAAIYKTIAIREGANTRIKSRPQSAPGGPIQNVSYSNMKNSIMAINVANYD